MTSNISVPYEIIKRNRTEEFIELDTRFKQLRQNLMDIIKKQGKLYHQLNDYTNSDNRYEDVAFYDVVNYRVRNEPWRNALIMQDLVNEIVENEGIMQETHAAYLQTREDLDNLYLRVN